MSGAARRELRQALDAAAVVSHTIAPYCDRVVVAGSARRGTADVGDLELVIIPKMQVGAPDLFGHFPDPAPTLPAVLATLPSVVSVPKCGPRYQQAVFSLAGQPAIQVDLFSATPDTFGYILMLRTGGADFSRWMVTARTQGGARPGYLMVRDGAVWRIGGGITALLPVPDEDALFRAWAMRPVPVAERHRGYAGDGRWFL